MKRIGLPISRDGAYQRLQKHLEEGWRVTSIIMKRSLSFLIALSSKAGLKLKNLSGKQRNYVRTKIWQIANEIVKMAKQFNANIAVERLKHLRKHKGEWIKKSRKKVNRIPYAFFKRALKCVAEKEGIFIKEVKSSYTSQTCPRCGRIGKENWRGYSYFKCVKCGYEADRDRVASLNIALRAAPKVGVPKHYFWSQNPEGDATVSRHILKDEGCRWHQTTPKLQAHGFICG
jgi:putative transposase